MPAGICICVGGAGGACRTVVSLLACLTHFVNYASEM